jgi:hypothetical protein
MNMMWRVGQNIRTRLAILRRKRGYLPRVQHKSAANSLVRGHGARYVAKPLNRIALAMRGRRGCHDISRDAETLAGVPSSISLSVSVDEQGVRHGLLATRRSVRPHVIPTFPHMSTARGSVAAATRQPGNPGMRALTERSGSGEGGSASKVAIRGPRTSACVAALLGVERIISTDSGVAMRYLAKIIHCRPRFRLRSTADVGKTEFTLLATGN